MQAHVVTTPCRNHIQINYISWCRASCHCAKELLPSLPKVCQSVCSRLRVSTDPWVPVQVSSDPASWPCLWQVYCLQSHREYCASLCPCSWLFPLFLCSTARALGVTILVRFLYTWLLSGHIGSNNNKKNFFKNNDSNCVQRRNLRFFTISSLRSEPSPTHTLKWPRAQSCANYVQHIERSPCATCRVMCHVVRRDSSAVKYDRVEIAFIWVLFYWLNHQPMKEGRKPEFPEKTPGDELQKMPHAKARRFKPQARLEPAQQHWCLAKKADVLIVVPHVAQSLSLIISECV